DSPMSILRAPLRIPPNVLGWAVGWVELLRNPSPTAPRARPLMGFAALNPSYGSLQHVARICGRNQRLRVRLQQKALRNGFAAAGFDGSDVAGMIAVALLQRRARILVRGALGLGLGERNHAACVVADVALMEARRGDVPAEISAERRVAQHHWHAAKLVAI